MKKIISIFFLCTVFFTSTAQKVFNDTICQSIDYDTISANFIVEINASRMYYKETDALIQQNSMFVNHNFTRHNLSRMYNSDTIILRFWDEGIRIYRDAKKCLNLSPISAFESQIDSRTLSRKQKKILKRSIFKDKNGVSYLRIQATMVVINGGKRSWLIPKIYSENDGGGSNTSSYDKRLFNNTLIIADILNWKPIR